MWRLNHRRMLLKKVLFVLLNQLMIIGIYGKLCEVETGQNNIILDIEESRGDNVNVDNSPILPIHGDIEDEITLRLNDPEERSNIFKLNGKVLQLIHPLDRDKDNLSHIQFSISCTINSTPSRSRNIPIIVRVTDVNDETPEFISTPYEISIDEATSVGTTIFKDIKAIDMDAGVNGAVEYFIVQGTTKNLSSEKFSADGFETFSITYHHQGHITLVKSLDYERTQRYYLTIIASDRARNLSERLTATTTLTINIRDSDDLDPSFIYKDCLFFEGSCINPEYWINTIPGTVQQKLLIFPEAIRAIDQDALNASIRYTFLDGTPQSFNEYFEIDAITAKVRQLKLIDSSVNERQFVISVKAEEMTKLKRYAIAKLKINVKALDEFPPTVNASDVFGFVPENSPIGTQVLSLKNKLPIKISVLDEDYSTAIELPIYAFDLTSPLLAVKDGFLVVNDSQIDREKSDKILLQVIAREIRGNAASTPLSLSITVLDVNDNAPEIFEMQSVTIDAGKNKRYLIQAIAKDIDAANNSIITFSFSKTNSKFSIDSKLGTIYAIGPLNANEQYNLTVRATDVGDLFSETSLIVYVIASLNIKPPVFSKSIYQIHVNESTPINSTLINVHAEDPENSIVKYSITSGNELRQFEISRDKGSIRVIRKLDRETLTKYQLKIQAEDEEGLYSTANVNIQVIDENDNSPQFDEGALPYMFSIDEEKSNAFVGSVHAYDIDDGENGEISYSIPSQDLPFKINKETGEIFTKEKLKYKEKCDYEFLIKATDHGTPIPLSSEIRIKIIVKDNPTIIPVFEQNYIDVSVPENVENAFVASVKLTNRELFHSVKFVLKNNSDLFTMNEKTGEIYVLKYLDYEMKMSHELIAGISESDDNFVKIKVRVEDRNDVAPIFLTSPEPVSVTDDQSIGSFIASLNAVDTDSAGSPGSIVRYEMIGKGKALKYFNIDPENGSIKIKDDLSKEPTIRQYEINVRAYDLGEPQLSSMANLLVFVKHIYLQNVEGTTTRSIEVIEDLSLAFSDETYVTNIPESTNSNAIIKLIPILNAKKSSSKINFACEIIAGNDMNLFTITIEDLACAVKLRNNLDYENETSHELSIKLHSSHQRINSLKNSAVLKIFVQDVNDNPPFFKFRQSNTYKRFPKRNNSYYGIVNYDSSIGTNVIKVEAYDEDSSTFGLIKYKLLDEKMEVSYRSEDLPSSYFIITETGMIRTRKPFYKIVNKQFSFRVEAADNYGRDNSFIHKTYARIVINVLSDFNRLTLAISDITPGDASKHKNKLEEILSEKSKENMVQIEKFSYRKAMLSNGTIIELKDSTDVWFYVINPQTETILLRNETQMMNAQIITIISRLLHSQVDGIFGPLEIENEILHLEISNSRNDIQKRLDYSFISIVAVITLIIIIGIIYLVWWNRSRPFQNSPEVFAENNQSISSIHSSVFHVDNNKRQNVQVNLKELKVTYSGNAR